MTDYAATAFGADQITDSDEFNSDVIAHRDFTDEEVKHLMSDIVSDSFSLEHPETTSPNGSDGSYRGRFMRGKEKEFLATVEAYEALYTSSGDGHLDSLRDCRKFAIFKREKVSGEVKVFSSACRERWCPMCAGQKASYAKEQTKMFIESLKAPRFLTLTLKHNDADLKFQIDFLTESFRTLRQRAYWKRHVTGGIWFLQIKRGKNSELWHPHLHILLDGESMVQSRLSQLWEQVTFGSPVIDIRKIVDVEYLSNYVARYCARPAVLKNMPLLDRIEVITSLFRKRLCGTFGTAKTVTLTPPKIEADGEWQDVGFYDEVIRDAKKNPKAQAILRAYFTDQILSEEHFEAYTGHPVNVEYVPYERGTDPQLWLDFYNT